MPSTARQYKQLLHRVPRVGRKSVFFAYARQAGGKSAREPLEVRSPAFRRCSAGRVGIRFMPPPPEGGPRLSIENSCWHKN